MKMKFIFAAMPLMLLMLATGCTTSKVKAQVNIFDYSQKMEGLKTPDMFDDGFRFELQDGDEQVEALGLGRSASEMNSAHGQERMSRAEEWGYSLVALDGIKDGMGREIKSTITGDNVPTSRQDAVNKINQYLDNQYKSLSLSKVYVSMNGHYPWHHYAGEDGFNILGSEIGEGINNYQWHIALNRGAARQFNTPWFIDFSMWNSGSILDYGETPKWGDNSSPTGGHSLSLFERSMIMSYMSGANSLVAEAGGYIAFNSDGSVSPYGEVCKKINSFTTDMPDRGVSYTPFAIVLDYYHGTYSGVSKKLAFNTFKYNAGDKMTDKLINMIWKNGIDRQDYKKAISEKGTMLNNGYGDLFDVLLQDADENVLAKYPCIVLSGSIEFSQEDINKFTAYAANGGTLVLNSAYADKFGEVTESYKGFGRKDISVGSGKIIVYGGDYSVKKLDSILKELTMKYVPFTFSDNIEYLVNVKDNELLLTLINNNGVDKIKNAVATVDNKKDEEITIGYNGTQRLDSVSTVYGEAKPLVQDNSVKITIPAGECVILKYSLGE